MITPSRRFTVPSGAIWGNLVQFVCRSRDKNTDPRINGQAALPPEPQMPLVTLNAQSEYPELGPSHCEESHK